MSALDSDPNTLASIIRDPGFDEAKVAAAPLLARCRRVAGAFGEGGNPEGVTVSTFWE
jgi:hypothetical protein